MVFVASYPPDSVGILRAVNEIGVGDNVKIFGGGMVGCSLPRTWNRWGSLLNGVINYNSWLPEPSMFFDGTKEFFAKYAPRAIEAKVDPLGYYLAPFGYAWASCSRRPSTPPRGFDQKALAKYLRENEHKTIVGRSPSRRTGSVRFLRRCRRSTAASSTRTSTSSRPRASR
jgi:branched-chain amino acid transport system substrate-binding protein